MDSRNSRKEELVDHRQQLGQEGENQALQFLRAKGYQLLISRFRTRYGELDLVMRDGDTIVFVEVKSRQGHGFGIPADSVHKKKRNHLAKAALICIAAKGFHDRPIRFDVVSVMEGKIEHITDAFMVDGPYYY